MMRPLVAALCTALAATAAPSYVTTFSALSAAELNLTAWEPSYTYLAATARLPHLVAVETLGLGRTVLSTMFARMSESSAAVELAVALAFLDSVVNDNGTRDAFEAWAAPRLQVFLAAFVSPNLTAVNNVTTPNQFRLRALVLGLRLAQVVRFQTSALTLRLNRLSVLTPTEAWQLKGFIPAAAAEASAAPAASGSGNHATLADAIKQALGEGAKPTTATTTTHSPTAQPTPLPDSFSLVGTAVGAVQDQGSCGGCYAFASSASLEGALSVQTGAPITTLSEQQIISCSPLPNQGCSGGSMVTSWNYIAGLLGGGLAAQAIYPYSSVTGGTTASCSTSEQAKGVVTTANASQPSGGYQTPRSDQALMTALMTLGPVAIGITTPSCFETYTSGVLTQANCACCTGVPGSDGCTLDHAVTVTGWGVADDGTAYWQVQNSWGTGWGQQGYVLLERGVAYPGMCGMFSEAAVPNLAALSAQCQVANPPQFCTAADTAPTVPPPSGGSDSLPAWVIVLIAFASFFGAIVLVYVVRFLCLHYLPGWKYNVFAERDDCARADSLCTQALTPHTADTPIPDAPVPEHED